MYDPVMRDVVAGAVTRIHVTLQRQTPTLAIPAGAWLRQLAGGQPPADHLLHPQAFPRFLLPYWAEQALTRHITPALQADLAYATANAYYYTCLADQLVAGNGAATSLLPALPFFQAELQQTYRPYFSAGHPFWAHFDQFWRPAAAGQAALLPGREEAQFRQRAAQSVCAGKIPLAALCRWHNQPHLLPRWCAFVDLLGIWHQLHRDVFGWYKDLTRQTETYFLWEARRRTRPGEAPAAWVMREGFDWGVSLLHTRLDELQQLAAGQLDSPAAWYYLARQAEMLAEQAAKVQAGFQNMRRLLPPPPPNA